MTNKKLWLSLLAVVLIVCMLSVGLMSCKKDKDVDDDDDEEEPITVEEQAATAIVEGIQKSMAAGDMTDLKVDGQVDLTVGEKKYTIALALDLDLLQHDGWTYNQCTSSTKFNPKEKYFTKEDDEYEEAKDLDEATFNADKTKYYDRSKKGKETSVKSNTFLNAEIREGDDVLLGVYYWDANKTISEDKAYTGDVIYVQFYDKDSGEQKQMYFPAPYVNAVMKANNAYVDFHGIKIDELDFWDTIGGVLPVIASLADKSKTVYQENSKASLTINLAAVLNNFASVLSSANSFVEPLGLDINLSNLGEILPAISITLGATFDSTGIATGVDLSLNIENKDMEIKKVKNGQVGETFLKIDMDKEVKVGLGLSYTVGTATPFYPDDLADYEKNNNIVDLDLSVDLYIEKDIKISITDAISIDIPGGKYTLFLSGQVNPFVILAEMKNLNFNDIAGVISSVKTILGAVEGLELELKQVEDKAGNATNVQALFAVLATQYQKVGATDTYTKSAGGIKATFTTTLLNGYDNFPVIQGMDIDSLISTVQKIIVKLVQNKSDESPSTEGEEEDKITPILQQVGAYLAGAYIGINDKEDRHGKIFASFDTDDTKYGFIPFSGYTKWSGVPSTEAQAKWQFYTKTEGQYQAAPATYNANETYYTLHGGYARKVVTTGDNAEEFNPTRKYYTSSIAEPTEAELKVKTNFTEATGLEKFATGTTYYVWVQEEYWAEAVKSDEYASKKANLYIRTADTYTKATTFTKGTDYYVLGASEKDGDFGIDIAATIMVDYDEDNGLDIVIDATKLGDLDIFGLPADFSAKISNINLTLWRNDPIIYISGVGASRYSTVKGKIA